MRAIILITLALGMTLLAAGCDNQPSFTSIEAIKLAKGATKTTGHPPTLYYINDPMVGIGSDMRSWPDEPGVKSGSFDAGGSYDHTPITFTTQVNINGGGYNVTFKSEWQEQGVTIQTHSWLFHINADRSAMFVREEGDTLPPAPERGPLL